MKVRTEFSFFPCLFIAPIRLPSATKALMSAPSASLINSYAITLAPNPLKASKTEVAAF
jgi:hypothetical protein